MQGPKDDPGVNTRYVRTIHSIKHFILCQNFQFLEIISTESNPQVNKTFLIFFVEILLSTVLMSLCVFLFINYF